MALLVGGAMLAATATLAVVPTPAAGGAWTPTIGTGDTWRLAPNPQPGSVAQRFEPGEILALSPDPAFIPQARELGFAPLERVHLAGLGLDLVRLATPAAAMTVSFRSDVVAEADGAATHRALQLFRTAFPGVTADVNAWIRPAAERRERAAGAANPWPSIRSTCGAGMRLGMIDTPVDTDHAALRGQRLVHRSFVAADKPPASAEHGTAVASLLLGRPDTAWFGGLLPEAELFAGSVFERRDGGRAIGQLFALLKALDWMVLERVSVLNLSFETGENTILSKALEKAEGKGVLLTAAAGTLGTGTGPAYPAAHPGVLAATAVDRSLRPYRYAKHGDYIDFAAPGVGLWTAAPGGGRFQSGTSFAVPFLTAAVALHLADATQEADARSVRGALARTARDLGAPGKDDVFGWGLLAIRANCP